jgi:hypothetical protein
VHKHALVLLLLLLLVAGCWLLVLLRGTSRAKTPSTCLFQNNF